MKSMKKCLVVLWLGLIVGRLSAQVSVSRLAPAGLVSDQLLVSLDSLFAGKSYEAVAGSSLQLMNFYPLDKDRHWVSVGCVDSGAVNKIFSFVARYEMGRYSFASPLGWLTGTGRPRWSGVSPITILPVSILREPRRLTEERDHREETGARSGKPAFLLNR